ncbi:hypothetical protein HLB44_13250 [Aquincola sp. S2]|uniref:Bacterial transcriptional activator domain-containing protein n=1 Tax=Pseudaquabacterium terrae TaxID=2732868 RepID=A0ABX2EH54_9BURK|nr:hypothetical protein [Aquabacterium terrae]NRF67953.1 hypothetical protein [Aquabacterium terrae]
MARLLAGEAGLRGDLRDVLETARAAGDADRASRLAALLLLDTLTDYADFRGLKSALASFDPALAASGDPADRRRADAVVLGRPMLDHAWTFEGPGVAAARERLFAVLRDDAQVPPDERLLLAKVLLDHDNLGANRVEEHERVLLLMQPVWPQASPRWQAGWWTLSALMLEYAGLHDAARAAAQMQRELVARLDLPELNMLQADTELRQALQADDLARADRAARQIEQQRPRVRPALVPRALSAQVALLLRRGEYEEALLRTQVILAISADHEVPERDCGAYLLQRAFALLGLGRADEALAELDAMRPAQHGSQRELLEAILAQVRAIRALAALEAPAGRVPADATAAARDTAAHDAAREVALQAVRLTAAAGNRRFLSAFPQWAARLIAIGLDAGVETEFLNRAARQRRLPPPEPAREHWPWPLHVNVLGGLRVRRDGQPLAGDAGKAPRKPLELLALLAAHPAGLPAEAVIDALWPSLEAEAPRASLDMALSRLRKWLDCPEAVRVADGRIGLNPTQVWIDVLALEAACDAGDAARALALYRGPLLQGERLDGALAHARDRLAQRLAACVLQAGAVLARQGRRADALALVGRGLAAEPKADGLRAALRGGLAG